LEILRVAGEGGLDENSMEELKEILEREK